MELDALRIDKWLWAARFFKTRSLAAEAVQRGHVQSNKVDLKPSKEVRIGDVLTIWQARVPHTVVVQGISNQRGAAQVAQRLYTETPQSLQNREKEALSRRLSPEPALTFEHGRPTKKDRRDLQKGWGET